MSAGHSPQTVKPSRDNDKRPDDEIGQNDEKSAKDEKGEAEAEVAKKCAAFGRGGCQVVSFSGKQCGALATFIGNYKRRRWLLSFTAGGETYPEAQNAALGQCNSDERSQGRCTSRIAACADGR